MESLVIILRIQFHHGDNNITTYSLATFPHRNRLDYNFLIRGEGIDSYKLIRGLNQLLVFIIGIYCVLFIQLKFVWWYQHMEYTFELTLWYFSMFIHSSLQNYVKLQLAYQDQKNTHQNPVYTERYRYWHTNHETDHNSMHVVVNNHPPPPRNIVL